jgi:hypothetical protein
MNKYNILKFVFIGLIAGLLLGYFFFYQEDSNARREYGPSGLPSNCKALIYEIEADYYLYEKHSHEDLLKSLFRNCGETGHLWDE